MAKREADETISRFLRSNPAVKEKSIRLEDEHVPWQQEYRAVEGILERNIQINVSGKDTQDTRNMEIILETKLDERHSS
jgi:hypothetical protein